MCRVAASWKQCRCDLYSAPKNGNLVSQLQVIGRKGQSRAIWINDRDEQVVHVARTMDWGCAGANHGLGLVSKNTGNVVVARQAGRIEIGDPRGSWPCGNAH